MPGHGLGHLGRWCGRQGLRAGHVEVLPRLEVGPASRLGNDGLSVEGEIPPPAAAASTAATATTIASGRRATPCWPRGDGR